MPQFEHAHDFNIYGGTFTSVKTQEHNVPMSDEAVRSFFKHAVSSAAQHDSAHQCNPTTCYPGTRVAVLHAIETWAHVGDQEKPILWLSGAAGAGKSTIAQTLSDRWSKEGRLAASFFFSFMDNERNNKTTLIPTLVYQLTRSFPSMIPYISKAIIDDPMVLTKSLKTQMLNLIIRPLTVPHLAIRMPHPPKVIIIDGLEECVAKHSNVTEREEQQAEILDAIAYAADHHTLPIRFLISSRREHLPREKFGEPHLAQMTQHLVLDATFNPNADIELYLRCKFEVLARNRSLNSWPPPDTIRLLVKRSSGYFIYPATAAKFIAAPRADPQHNLEIILGEASPEHVDDEPFEELDKLYTRILQAVAPASQRIVCNILGAMHYSGRAGFREIISLAFVFPTEMYQSPGYFANLYGISLVRLQAHLIDLHSILDIPSGNEAHQKPISFLHASFPDFLADRNRSGTYAPTWLKVVVPQTATLLKRFIFMPDVIWFCTFRLVAFLHSSAVPPELSSVFHYLSYFFLLAKLFFFELSTLFLRLFQIIIAATMALPISTKGLSPAEMALLRNRRRYAWILFFAHWAITLICENHDGTLDILSVIDSLALRLMCILILNRVLAHPYSILLFDIYEKRRLSPVFPNTSVL